jgi:dipeptidyl aminopeptidase/acylaminoacyl peptidase
MPPTSIVPPVRRRQLRPDGGWDDVKWAPDGKTLAFVSTSRDHKHEWFRIADAATGACARCSRKAYPDLLRKRQRRRSTGVPAGQRTRRSGSPSAANWGNLYLYDLDTGKLKHAITTGDGNVTQVLKVDAKTRTVWFRGVGRDPGRRSVLPAVLEGQPRRRQADDLLTPEAADHTVDAVAGRQAVRRRLFHPTVPPVTVLRAPTTATPSPPWPRPTSAPESCRLGAAGAVHGQGA